MKLSIQLSFLCEMTSCRAQSDVTSDVTFNENEAVLLFSRLIVLAS